MNIEAIEKNDMHHRNNYFLDSKSGINNGSNFSQELAKNNNKSRDQESSEIKDEGANLWTIFEDIKSLMKKGATVEEIEEIEKYMKEILKRLDKDSPSKKEIKEVKEFLEYIEQMIMRIKKRISGQYIKDDDKNLATSLDKDSLTISFSSGETIKIDGLSTKISEVLINRIDEAIDGLKDIKEARQMALHTESRSTKDELTLLNQIKSFQK